MQTRLFTLEPPAARHHVEAIEVRPVTNSLNTQDTVAPAFVYFTRFNDGTPALVTK